MTLTRTKNIFMPQNANCITVMITLKDIGKQITEKMTTKHSAQNAPQRVFLVSEVLASRFLSDINLLHELISYCRLILVLIVLLTFISQRGTMNA